MWPMPRYAVQVGFFYPRVDISRGLERQNWDYVGCKLGQWIVERSNLVPGTGPCQYR
jgi:hypothetical protein